MLTKIRNPAEYDNVNIISETGLHRKKLEYKYQVLWLKITYFMK